MFLDSTNDRSTFRQLLQLVKRLAKKHCNISVDEFIGHRLGLRNFYIFEIMIKITTDFKSGRVNFSYLFRVYLVFITKYNKNVYIHG